MESAERKNDWPGIITLTKIPLSDVGKKKGIFRWAKAKKIHYHQTSLQIMLKYYQAKGNVPVRNSALNEGMKRARIGLHIGKCKCHFFVSSFQ